MENTNLGERLAQMRKQFSMTQEALADKLGVTAQAVSKWENGITSPDISLLPQIAEIYGTTVDYLLGATPKAVVSNLKPAADLMFRINVLSANGDKVNINLPFKIVTSMLTAGVNIDKSVSIGKSDALKDIDFKALADAVEMGLRGNIVDISSADGDIVKIIVE